MTNLTTTTPADDEYPFLSAVSDLLDEFLVLEHDSEIVACEPHDIATLPQMKRAIRWQARFLLASEEDYLRYSRVLARLVRMPSPARDRNATRLRKLLVADLVSLRDGPSPQNHSKRGQRFVLLVITEVMRAMDLSQDEAIRTISDFSAKIPEVPYVGESTLRSWYNKSGVEHRGLKQVASWSVSNWKYLAINVLAVISRQVRPGFDLARSAMEVGVISRSELSSVETMARNICLALKQAVIVLEATPSPSVRNGSQNVDISKVSREVLPMLGL